MRAPNDAVREELLKQLKGTQAEAMAKIKQLAALKADATIVSGLEENVKNLDAMINSLNSASRERLDTMATRDKQFTAMRAAHAAAIGSIDTAITDARINMNTALGDNASTVEVLAAMNGIEKLNTLLADVNLLSGNMSAAPLATSSDTIEKYRDEQKDIRKRIEDGAAKLGDSFIEMQIKDRVGKLVAFGTRQDQHLLAAGEGDRRRRIRRSVAGGSAQTLDRPRLRREAARRDRPGQHGSGNPKRP